MATNTAGTNARDLGIQAVHYLRKDIATTDLSLATDENVVGILPAGAVVLRMTLGVTEAFDDATADTVDVGYTAGGDDLGAAMAAGATGIDVGDIVAATMVPLAADQTVYVAAAVDATTVNSTGAASVIVEYIVN